MERLPLVTNDASEQARRRLELGDIFRAYGAAFLRARGAALSIDQQRALRELAVCRTATLGGHRRECRECGHLLYQYNSCRNRNCVTCGWGKRLLWREHRMAEMLDVEYFHVVLTLPDELAQLARYNQTVMRDILCRAAAHAILSIGREWKHLRAQMGLILVPHGWGQLMNDHLHAHILAPGGGISLDGTRWVSLPRGFFLPRAWMRQRFRDTFLEMLKKAYWRGRLVFRGEMAAIQMPEAFEMWLDALARREWITHAASTEAYRGHAGREQAVKYLAHYASGVAMSNKRIQSIDGGQVTFTYKDYRRQEDPGRPAPIRTMTLPAFEFIERFLSHVPENGSRRFRYYGFLAPGVRREKLALIRRMIGQAEPEAAGGDEHDDQAPEDDRADPLERDRCPACGQAAMATVYSRSKPRVSEIMATPWSDLFQLRMTQWDEF